MKKTFLNMVLIKVMILTPVCFVHGMETHDDHDINNFLAESYSSTSGDCILSQIFENNNDGEETPQSFMTEAFFQHDSTQRSVDLLQPTSELTQCSEQFQQRNCPNELSLFDFATADECTLDMMLLQNLAQHYDDSSFTNSTDFGLSVLDSSPLIPGADLQQGMAEPMTPLGKRKQSSLLAGNVPQPAISMIMSSPNPEEVAAVEDELPKRKKQKEAAIIQDLDEKLESYLTAKELGKLDETQKQILVMLLNKEYPRPSINPNMIHYSIDHYIKLASRILRHQPPAKIKEKLYSAALSTLSKQANIMRHKKFLLTAQVIKEQDWALCVANGQSAPSKGPALQPIVVKQLSDSQLQEYEGRYRLELNQALARLGIENHGFTQTQIGKLCAIFTMKTFKLNKKIPGRLYGHDRLIAIAAMIFLKQPRENLATKLGVTPRDIRQLKREDALVRSGIIDQADYYQYLSQKDKSLKSNEINSSSSIPTALSPDHSNQGQLTPLSLHHDDKSVESLPSIDMSSIIDSNDDIGWSALASPPLTPGNDITGSAPLDAGTYELLKDFQQTLEEPMAPLGKRKLSSLLEGNVPLSSIDMLMSSPNPEEVAAVDDELPKRKKQKEAATTPDLDKKLESYLSAKELGKLDEPQKQRLAELANKGIFRRSRSPKGIYYGIDHYIKLASRILRHQPSTKIREKLYNATLSILSKQNNINRHKEFLLKEKIITEQDWAQCVVKGRRVQSKRPTFSPIVVKQLSDSQLQEYEEKYRDNLERSLARLEIDGARLTKTQIGKLCSVFTLKTIKPNKKIPGKLYGHDRLIAIAAMIFLKQPRENLSTKLGVLHGTICKLKREESLMRSGVVDQNEYYQYFSKEYKALQSNEIKSLSSIPAALSQDHPNQGQLTPLSLSHDDGSVESLPSIDMSSILDANDIGWSSLASPPLNPGNDFTDGALLDAGTYELLKDFQQSLDEPLTSLGERKHSSLLEDHVPQSAIDMLMSSFNPEEVAAAEVALPNRKKQKEAATTQDPDEKLESYLTAKELGKLDETQKHKLVELLNKGVSRPARNPNLIHYGIDHYIKLASRILRHQPPAKIKEKLYNATLSACSKQNNINRHKEFLLKEGMITEQDWAQCVVKGRRTQSKGSTLKAIVVKQLNDLQLQEYEDKYRDNLERVLARLEIDSAQLTKTQIGKLCSVFSVKPRKLKKKIPGKLYDHDRLIAVATQIFLGQPRENLATKLGVPPSELSQVKREDALIRLGVVDQVDYYQYFSQKSKGLKSKQITAPKLKKKATKQPLIHQISDLQLQEHVNKYRMKLDQSLISLGIESANFNAAQIGRLCAIFSLADWERNKRIPGRAYGHDRLLIIAAMIFTKQPQEVLAKKLGVSLKELSQLKREDALIRSGIIDQEEYCQYFAEKSSPMGGIQTPRLEKASAVSNLEEKLQNANNSNNILSPAVLSDLSTCQPFNLDPFFVDSDILEGSEGLRVPDSPANLFATYDDMEGDNDGELLDLLMGDYFELPEE